MVYINEWENQDVTQHSETEILAWKRMFGVGFCFKVTSFPVLGNNFRSSYWTGRFHSSQFSHWQKHAGLLASSWLMHITVSDGDRLSHGPQRSPGVHDSYSWGTAEQPWAQSVVKFPEVVSELFLSVVSLTLCSVILKLCKSSQRPQTSIIQDIRKHTTQITTRARLYVIIEMLFTRKYCIHVVQREDVYTCVCVCTCGEADCQEWTVRRMTSPGTASDKSDTILWHLTESDKNNIIFIGYKLRNKIWSN